MSTKPRLTPEPPPVAGARWIALTQEKFALVDEEDFDQLSEFSWSYGPKDMAHRASTVGGRHKVYLMHREVMKAPLGVQVDHINGNQRDNRKSNLRFATNQQNLANRGPQKNNTSGYKGVTRAYVTRAGVKWMAKIQVGARTINLGVFLDPIEAARAYDQAAIEHFGEFAGLNGV